MSEFVDKLKERWGVHTPWQVFVILLVFAMTGFSVLFLEEQVYRLLGISAPEQWYLRALLFIVITLPLYNLILLVYGFIFGQFRFFWNFEKRFFGRILRMIGVKMKD